MPDESQVDRPTQQQQQLTAGDGQGAYISGRHFSSVTIQSSSAHLKDHGACHCHGSVPNTTNSSSAHASNDSRDDVSWRHKTHLPDSSRRAVSILVKCTVQTDKMNIGQVRSASKTGPRCCFPELRGRISLKPNHASAPTPTETATKAAET